MRSHYNIRKNQDRSSRESFLPPVNPDVARLFQPAPLYSRCSKKKLRRSLFRPITEVVRSCLIQPFQLLSTPSLQHFEFLKLSDFRLCPPTIDKHKATTARNFPSTGHQDRVRSLREFQLEPKHCLQHFEFSKARLL